jgi:hypothetical protein
MVQRLEANPDIVGGFEGSGAINRLLLKKNLRMT